MWLGNEPSNWGTNSQPARTVDSLKTRKSVTSPTRADYPIKGLQQHPVKDASGSDNSKYLKFPYPSSKSGEVHRVVLTAHQTGILYSPLSTISSQQPKYLTHSQIYIEIPKIHIFILKILKYVKTQNIFSMPHKNITFNNWIINISKIPFKTSCIIFLKIHIKYTFNTQLCQSTIQTSNSTHEYNIFVKSLKHYA